MTITLSEYQQRAETQDTMYFDRDRPKDFYALSVAGEAGEVVDEAKKLLYYAGHRDEHGTQRLQLELGDLLWSVARLASKFGLTLEDIVLAHGAKLAQKHSSQTLPATK